MPAKSFAVLVKSLRDQRRAIALWAVAFVVVCVVYSAYWGQIRNTPSIVDPVRSMPKGLVNALNFTDLTSAAGYLRGTVFGLLGPLLMLIVAVLGGTRAVATDEESGVLDVYLSYPLSRRRLVLERFGALCLQLSALGLVLFLAIYLLANGLDMGIGADRLLAASLGLVLLGLCFATVALAVGAMTGRRALALSVSAAAAAGSYLLNAVVSQVHAIRWLNLLSPFHYYLGGDPLTRGFNWPNLLVLVAVVVALLAAATAVFERRDINV
jgi:ABC-2 type transport system permease protein